MLWLKQSTAVTVKIGPFNDSTDGNTAETGLTIAQADVRLSKNGGNIAQKTEATSCTHDELGIYGCPLDTTDTGTLGRLQLWVHEAGALPVWHEFMVVPANVWDSFFGADALQVHANEITAGLITATAVANAAIDNATFAADVGSTAYATNIIALAVRKVLDEINLDHLLAVVTAAADMTTEVIDNSILARVLGNGDTSTFVPSTDGLHAAGVDLDAILADTNELQADDVPTLIAALPTAAENANEWETQSQADPTGFHVNVMESLSQPGKFDSLYGGLAGPGVWIDAGANTNTVSGVDGIHSNPVSTLTAARTIADALGYKTYYLLGGISLTIAATHEDWHFIGLGEPTSNRINLGSQDVDRSGFVNLEVVGVQGGTGRIIVRGGAINDPGAGVTTLHAFACATMFTGDFELDTSNDNIFDQCFSGVAGAAAPIITATGAAGTAVFRHYSGGIEFKALSASHNVSCETDGQVVFNADCNVNATVALRGNMTITDNTAGMNNLSRDAALNGAYINVQADTALTDYDPPTNAEMEARTLPTADYFDPAADAVANVTLVATTTTNTDVRGTDNAALASVCTEARLAELDAANLPTDIADVPTVAEFNARTQPTADYFDPAADAVANVTLVATTTTNTDVRGTDNAALASVCTEARLAELAAANLPTDVDAILADTNELQTDDVPGLIAALNDPAASAIADAVWNELSTGHVDAGKAGQQLWTDLDAVLADTNELQTDDVPGLIAALNDPTAAAIADAVWDEDIVAAHNTAATAGLLLDTDLATILADTNELQTDDVPGLIAALNDPTAAAIRTEMDSNSTQLAAIVADTNELQTDDVPGLIAALNDPTAAGIADAVWDELATGHTDAGKAGQQLWTDLDAVLADTNELQADDVPGLIAALNDPTAAAIRTEIDSNSTQLAAIVADTNELQTDWADGGRLDLILDAASAPSAAAVADAVWDEANADHVGAGTTGKSLSDAGSGASAATIADAVWDEAKADHVSAESFGEEVQAHALSSEVATAAEIWAYTTRTLTQSAASITAAVSGTDLSIHRGDSLSAAITGLGDISGRTKLWFTVKEKAAHPDTAATFQIEETDGLVYIDGNDAVTTGNGVITVDDGAAGDITVTLDEAETAKLRPNNALVYDVQVLDSGSVSTLAAGDAEVTADVTRVVA